ncbi:MAG: sulfite exporter TauE/SafE family protein, partial [Planctomycetaceae bacterium]|nr:sulfite exporter TauE/SafE family protein [Planctomycetaceae bacterium]
RSNLARQLLYSSGRIFTYAAAGAMVGYAGLRLARLAPTTFNIQAALAIVAGCILVVQGLAAAGLLPRNRLTAAAGCLPARLFGPLLRGTGATGYFLAGMFTGFLPCGLVYAYLALAAASGSLQHGLATMIAFGLGTVPLMVLTGLGGSALSLTWRQRALQVAAVCVIVTGIVSVARGASALEATPDRQPACPLCGTHE